MFFSALAPSALVDGEISASLDGVKQVVTFLFTQFGSLVTTIASQPLLLLVFSSPDLSLDLRRDLFTNPDNTLGCYPSRAWLYRHALFLGGFYVRFMFYPYRSH